MPNLIFSPIYESISIVSGCHFYLFTVTDEDFTDGELRFRDQTINFDIESDEKLLKIIKTLTIEKASKGVVDFYIFWYKDKIGLLPEFSTLIEKVEETMKATIANFRQSDLNTMKPKRRKNVSKRLSKPLNSNSVESI